jgi:hypothetical protein
MAQKGGTYASVWRLHPGRDGPSASSGDLSVTGYASGCARGKDRPEQGELLVSDKAGDRRQRRVLDHALEGRSELDLSVGWTSDEKGPEGAHRCLPPSGAWTPAMDERGSPRDSCRSAQRRHEIGACPAMAQSFAGEEAAPRRRACCARPFPSSWATADNLDQAGQVVDRRREPCCVEREGVQGAASASIGSSLARRLCLRPHERSQRRQRRRAPAAIFRPPDDDDNDDLVPLELSKHPLSQLPPLPSQTLAPSVDALLVVRQNAAASPAALLALRPRAPTPLAAHPASHVVRDGLHLDLGQPLLTLL